MDARKGYYTLIQFRPDASRLEAVNMGILLFCPETGFIAAPGQNQSAGRESGRSRAAQFRPQQRQTRSGAPAEDRFGRL